MFTWTALLDVGRCTGRAPVMGIVNVTPDSFSDGGRYLDPGRAVDHAVRLADAGAIVLDVGGESTRPGAEPVSAAVEIDRVVPVIRRLASRVEPPVAISVDTTKAEVAAAALAAGATIVNDVSAGRFDPPILDVTARAGAGYVAMHMQGEPATMQVDPRYADVVAEVGACLTERVAAATAAGVAPGAVMVDPGIGFGKRLEHNLALLAALPALAERVQAPVLVGTSRKSFISAVLGGEGRAVREDGTLATVVWALDHGAALVRVHDVAAAAAAAAVVAATEEAA
ncbi:MAG TPA: dihydropteroate synthase [Acidimicrobiia bacterium]|nr:dihydropteroate synthase [Acidimicrobiia bacterium]